LLHLPAIFEITSRLMTHILDRVVPAVMKNAID
jgi:hypothetical protein